MTRGVVVVRGQQPSFPLTGAGTFAGGQPQSLIRAEDPHHRVGAWQVTLSPVFKRQVGSDFLGQPSRVIGAPGTTGQFDVRMTWGGGGVKFRTRFAYPVNGASFAVAGDNIMVDVQPFDTTTVWTEATLPAVMGWVAEHSHPTAQQPMIVDANADLSPATTTNPIEPWARALFVYRSNPAATVELRFLRTDGVVITTVLPATSSPGERIPIENDWVRFGVTPSLGGAFVGLELVFT